MTKTVKHFLVGASMVAGVLSTSAFADPAQKPAPTAATVSPKGYAPAQTIPDQSAAAAREAGDAKATAAPKSHKTWVTIQRYNMENNGEPGSPISNVRLELTFPDGRKIQLPEGGQFWPIGNGQVQEINRTFEIPEQWVQQKDGFKFRVQMIRKGSDFLPCDFDVVQLSQFDRGYTCHTDLAWQQQHRLTDDKQDKEGIQVRVFTDLNLPKKELPTDAIALKP